MDTNKLLRARNDGKVEWTTTRCILSVRERSLFMAGVGAEEKMVG